MSAPLPPHAQVPGGEEEEEVKNTISFQTLLQNTVPHVFITQAAQKLHGVDKGYGNWFTDRTSTVRLSAFSHVTQEACGEGEH